MVEFIELTKNIEDTLSQEIEYDCVDPKTGEICKYILFNTSTRIFLEPFRRSLTEEEFSSLKNLPMYGDFFDGSPKLLEDTSFKEFIASAHMSNLDILDSPYLLYSHNFELFHPEDENTPSIIDMVNKDNRDYSARLISEDTRDTYSALVLFEKRDIEA